MEQRIVRSATFAVNDLIRLAKVGGSKLWMDYDEEVDALYISFDMPQKADDARQGRDGIIRRTRKNKLVGLTILDASRFLKK